MKLPVGVTIYLGNKRYSGDIPDKLVTDDTKKIIEQASKKKVSSEKMAGSQGSCPTSNKTEGGSTKPSVTNSGGKK